jgi:hypothetical protein
MKIANAFSLNMVEFPATISCSKISHEQIKCIGCTGKPVLESVIGHADTAAIVSGILGIELPANRASVKLQPGEKMIVAQYSGPRLPEGTTVLPENAKIEFILVEVN